MCDKDVNENRDTHIIYTSVAIRCELEQPNAY